LSVSLAAALHGILVFAALTMVMGASVPRPVIGISLLSDLGSGTGTASEPFVQERASAGTVAPAVTPHADPAASGDAARSQVRPALTAQKNTAVQVVPEKIRSKPVVAIRSQAKPREPAPRVKTGAVSPLASEETRQSSAPGNEDHGAGGDNSATDVRQQQTTGSLASALSGAFGQLGAMAGQSGVGSEAGGDPVGASFGDADGPRFVQRVMPRYPELARRRGREGLVLLRLVIGPGGELRDVQVVEGGGHGFDEAALAAVRTSLYAPAMRGGRGVECAALLPIRFALKGS